MNKIRILHFVSSLSKGNGVMSVMMNYYKHINREKVQFDFIFFKDVDNNYKDEIQNYGGKVYFISKPSLTKKFKEEFIDILNREKYESFYSYLN